MRSTTDRDRGLGESFPRPIDHLLLVALLPTHRREELVGDLIEEAETIVAPKHGRRVARRWFWHQVFASASPLYAHRSGKEITMNRWKWMTLVLILVAGPLMALDPSVLGASPTVLALVAFAILIPAAAGLLSGNLNMLAGAAVVSGALLLAGRLASGIEIRWYAMAFVLFVILNAGRWLERRSSVAGG
jgi:hypothetical protein